MFRQALPLFVCFVLVGNLGSAAIGRAAEPTAALRTVGENSGYSRTGRYEEVIRLCHAFASAYPKKVRCQRFGDTPEGRPMLTLIASQDGVLEPAAAREKKRPVVLAQGGIHAGEIEGKDAGFLLLRQLLTGERGKGLLSRLTLVFVPVFNIDGHERFGPNQRPNQNGPLETGWRTTSQNLNLNRDYTKAEAPEMAAMLGLLSSWDPILYVDLHTTDGAQFQPDVAVMVEPRLIGPDGLRPLGTALSQRVMTGLSKSGHLPLDFYPSFVRTDEPSSGFANDMSSPRFSLGYRPLWNRFAILVETHSWRPYAHRVRTTIDTLETLLAATADDGPAWLRAAEEADRADLRLGGTSLPLDYDHGPRATRLRYPGYAYTHEPSAISGALRVRYDPKRPVIWDVPFYADVVPQRVVQVPAGGYVVPPALADLALAQLRRHGLSAERLPRELVLKGSDVEQFRIASHTIRPEPYEGRHPVEVKGEWQAQTKVRNSSDAAGFTLAAGSLIVPVAQRGGRIVVHLFEPGGPESLLSWGFLSGIFEQKEYMEEYVTESVAEEMLARDAALRGEFLRKLREEPAFARDPRARLAFFYRRHPCRDTRQDVYPVLRLLHPIGKTHVATAAAAAVTTP
jgi:murein tripeptide amidase MpaA